MNTELDDFVKSVEKYNWFCDFYLDNNKKLIIYVSYMDMKFISLVPQKISGTQILFHFIESKPVYKKHCAFCDKSCVNTLSVCSFHDKPHDEESNGYFSYEDGLNFLFDQIDHLEEICGYEILQDIFFEVCDGDDAVSNYSEEFPDVREELDSLVESFGIDILYDKIIDA